MKNFSLLRFPLLVLALMLNFSVGAASVVEQKAYLKSSQNRPAGRFGTSMAISGDTLVVGAPGDRNARDPADPSTALTGAAYVFVREGGNWVEQARLKSFEPRGDNQAQIDFGQSVAISGDTIVVGAEREFVNLLGENTVSYGAAYVFRRSGTNWTQEAHLQASDRHGGDHFGGSVTIFGDTIVVGAPQKDIVLIDGEGQEYPALESGAAYVFQRSGTVWTEQAILEAADRSEGGIFGRAVSLSGDTVVIGSPGRDSSRGAAYVFDRTGETWTQSTVLEADRSFFGQAAAIDGNTVVVCGNEFARVFTRSGASWSPRYYLVGSNQDVADSFGASVAISGESIIVGAPREDSDARGFNSYEAGENNNMESAGAAYLFEPYDSGWTQMLYLKASNTDANDLFGSAVAISGTIMMVGAPGEASHDFQVDGDQSDNSEPGAGAVYVVDIAVPLEPGIHLATGPVNASIFHPVKVAPGSVFVAPPGVDWAGGSLEIELPDPAPSGADTPLALDLNGFQWDAANRKISFFGAWVATLEPQTPRQLKLNLTSNASEEIIQYLIQSVTYNDTGWKGRHPASIFSSETTVTFRVRSQAGLEQVATRIVKLPSIRRLLSPPEVTLTLRARVVLAPVAEFSSGERLAVPVEEVDTQKPSWISQTDGTFEFVLEGPADRVQDESFIRFSYSYADSATKVISKIQACFIQHIAQAQLARETSQGAPKASETLTSPLTIFYSFRELMKQNAEGRRLVALYVEHAPELVQLAIANPELLTAAERTFTNFKPALDALLSGSGASFQITREQIDQLNAAWAQIAGAASPALKAVMDAERARFNGFEDFVGKNFSQWGAMLDVSVPTKPYVRVLGASKGTEHIAIEATYLPDLPYSLWRAPALAPEAWVRVSDPLIDFDPAAVILTDTNPPPSIQFYKVGVGNSPQ